MSRNVQSILDMPREELAKHRYFDLERLPVSGGRISIYEEPIADHIYVIGADGAHGLDHGDFDAGVVLDSSVRPVRQVAEVHGKWGEDQFDRILYVMLRYYCNAFLCAERQVLLTVMRSLIKNFRYHWMYYERDEVAKGAPQKDLLGHAKYAGDPSVHNFRTAVRDHNIVLRSATNISEVGKYQFRPKSGDVDDDGVHDGDLIMAAPRGKGHHDDLVMADVYAWKGVREMPRFMDERPRYVKGSAGDVLGHAEVFRDVAKKASAFRRHDRDDD